MIFRLTVATPFGIDSMVVTTVICDASYMPERGGEVLTIVEGGGARRIL